MTTITRELIDAGRTSSGGWTATQINLLGLQWPPAKGWRDKVIGKPITEQDARMFIALGATEKRIRLSLARTPRHERTWETPSLQEAMLRARLIGRHGKLRQVAFQSVHPGWFSADEVAMVDAAFDEGVRAREAGVRCMCNDCIFSPKIIDQEVRRVHYRSKRYAELTLSGFSDESAHKRIAEEMDKGAAL